MIKQAVIEDCYKTVISMENNFVLPLKELSPHLGGDIEDIDVREIGTTIPSVSYTHLRAHET